MTPAEANLHAIAAAFCAPRVVREVCPQCGGAEIIATNSSTNPFAHVQVCTACAGNGWYSIEYPGRTAP